MKKPTVFFTITRPPPPPPSSKHRFFNLEKIGDSPFALQGKQAGAELNQAQVKLEVKVEVIVKFRR